MTYAELHLTTQDSHRSSNSTRSRPVFELKEELDIHSFAVRYVNIPLTWMNFPTDSEFTITMTLKPVIALPLGLQVQTFSKTFTLPKGNYASPKNLSNALRSLTPKTVDDVEGEPRWSLVTMGITEYKESKNTGENKKPHMTISFAPDTTSFKWKSLAGALSNTAVKTVGTAVISFGTKSSPLSRAINQFWYEYDEFYNITKEITVDATSGALQQVVWNSDRGIKLFPSYLFLHSNLMLGVTRPSILSNGGDRNPDIMTKIPLDTNGKFGTSFIDYRGIMIFENYFQSQGKYSYLSFYLTDEDGEVLDFTGESFSLTLSMHLRE